MVMRTRYWIAFLLLGPATAWAWGNDCEFRADRAAGLDATGVEKVVIKAGAGDMKVFGLAKAVRIEARGVACAGSAAALARTLITARREGNIVYVETTFPENPGGLWQKGDSPYIDIGIALPVGIPVEATDSSGDAVFEDLKSLDLQDSSGDLQIRRITDAVNVIDSSGDLTIEGAGSVKAQDSSGDIEIDEVRGDVDIPNDSSGDIHIAHVGGSVDIHEDSSGGIRVEEVKGSVKVDSDSSGNIYAARVGGDFTVLSDSSGSIEHESIGGKISVPSDGSAGTER
jgi:Putative adhesin